MQEPTNRDSLEYLLAEAGRMLESGAYRMAMTWVYHARRLAGDDLAMAERADALLTAARHPS